MTSSTISSALYLSKIFWTDMWCFRANVFVSDCSITRAQIVERVHVVGQLIVVGNALKFELIGGDDGVITLVHQLCPVHDLVAPLVAVTFVYQHGSRDA